jgi:hypothetical protein
MVVIQPPDKSINRVLGWMQAGFLVIPKTLKIRKLSKLIVQEFEKAHEDESRNWLTVRRLTRAIYLDPNKAEDLATTVVILGGLKQPNRARQDRTRPKPDEPPKPPTEMLWGLIKYVGG